MSYLGYALLALVLLASAWVTHRALRAPYLNTRQKAIVVAVAWMLPILGPALAFSVLGDTGIRKRGDRVSLFEVVFLSAILSQASPGERSGSGEV